MVNKTVQKQYTQVLDHIAYLIATYPEAVSSLLSDYGMIFKGTPAAKDYSEAIIEKLKEGDTDFEKSLEKLIQQLNPNEEDQFLSGLIKGAVGVVGGLIRKRKERRSRRRAARSSVRSSSGSNISAQRAQRALERRIQQMQAAQARREAEARRRQELEAQRRREEAVKREAESKRKTQTMLMIGGGILVVGIGAAFMLRSNRPAYPYGPARPAVPYPPMP